MTNWFVLTVYIGVQKWLARVWKLVGILVNQSNCNHGNQEPPQQLQHWEQKIRELRNSYLMEVLTRLIPIKLRLVDD